MIGRLAIAGASSLTLVGCFLCSEAHSRIPADAASRVTAILIAALGPIALLPFAVGSPGTVIPIGSLSALSIACVIRWRRFAAVRWLGYLSMFGWVVVGATAARKLVS